MQAGWEMAYWICLIIGVAYTIITAALGGISGIIGHAGDSGSVSNSYGADGSTGGHGTASSADFDGSIIFGPFSPLVIAFFLTSFGGSGLVYVKYIPNSVLSLPAAIVTAIIFAWLLILFFNRVIAAVQSSSEVRILNMVGETAEVTVTIPATGMGEIAYVAMGSRNVSPARTDSGTDIPRFSNVRITRVSGNIFFVDKIDA